MGCRTITAAVLLAATVSPLRAQSSWDTATMQRVDQGVTDRDVLATSQYQLQPDLRSDQQFENLYVDPRDPTRYVRVAGGLYAVSPRTEYVNTRFGEFAMISAGTVFYIGPPSPYDPLLPMGVVVEPVIPANRITVQGLGQQATRATVIAGMAERAAPIINAVEAPEQMTHPEGAQLRPPLSMGDDEYRRRRLEGIARRYGIG
ncbi:MAG: hypothetical protein AAFX05_04995 [Planctomycetota bacterium]